MPPPKQKSEGGGGKVGKGGGVGREGRRVDVNEELKLL